MDKDKYRLSKEQREKLRKIRKEKHLAAEDVSVELGYSKAWLGQIERGKLQTIKQEELAKLIALYTDNEYKSNEMGKICEQFLKTGDVVLPKRERMTITEILEVIHEERVELEICQALQQWLIVDRNQWIDRAMNSEATVRAIHKIATENKKPKSALQGILALSEEETME